MILDQLFGRVVLLSLPDQEVRRARALRELKEKGLSDRVEVVVAIRGSELTPPAWWRAGKGAWGCLCSHRRELERAWVDKVDSILLLEDDVVWQDDSAERIAEFLSQVPEDWGQIYLGGQHRKPPEVLRSGVVVRGKSINRTHAYAVSRATLPKILAHIQHAPDFMPPVEKGKRPRAPHIDHQLEVAHRRADWPVYAPSFWVAGQGENKSSINNRDHQTQWWHWDHETAARNMPVVMVPEGEALPDWAEPLLHFGGSLEDETKIDKGNRDAGGESEALGRFVRMIAGEAYNRQRIPAVVVLHGEDVVRKAWGGREVLRLSETNEEALQARTRFLDEPWHRHPWRWKGVAPAAVESAVAGDAEEVPDLGGLIHQVWIGSNELAPRLAAYCETIRKAFPGWTYRMWTDDDLEQLAEKALMPEVVLGIRQVDLGIRVDVVRLEILRQHGGIYFDIDFEALRPDLRPLFQRRNCFYYADERVAFPLNSLLGAHEPGNAVVELYLQRIAANLRKKGKISVHWTSGPHQFNATINAWTDSEWSLHDELVVKDETVAALYGGGSLVAFYHRVACPYAYGKGTYATFNPDDHPRAWMAHHWAETWHTR